MNKVKLMIRKFRSSYYKFKYRKKISNGKSIYINGKCKFSTNMSLGTNIHFNGFEVKGKGRVTIGDNFHSGVDVKLLTSNHNYEGTHLPYDKTVINKEIVISSQVWIGDNVLILGGVTIGEGAIIQAGSVVSSDIPALSIAGGNPARVFKKRDVAHYESLKSDGNFF